MSLNLQVRQVLTLHRTVHGGRFEDAARKQPIAALRLVGSNEGWPRRWEATGTAEPRAELTPVITIGRWWALLVLGWGPRSIYDGHPCERAAMSLVPWIVCCGTTDFKAVNCFCVELYVTQHRERPRWCTGFKSTGFLGAGCCGFQTAVSGRAAKSVSRPSSPSNPKSETNTRRLLGSVGIGKLEVCY